jgi:hypothetical protein
VEIAAVFKNKPASIAVVFNHGLAAAIHHGDGFSVAALYVEKTHVCIIASLYANDIAGLHVQEKWASAHACRAVNARLLYEMIAAAVLGIYLKGKKGKDGNYSGCKLFVMHLDFSFCFLFAIALRAKVWRKNKGRVCGGNAQEP